MREHETKFWVSLATAHPGQIQSQLSRMERRGHWDSCQISVILVNVSIWSRSQLKAHFTDPGNPLYHL